MKFLIDMNLSPLWISFLSEHGFEAVHWSTIGEPGAVDSEIFDFAAAKGWIVFTLRSRFRHAAGGVATTGPSVIQVRAQDVLPSAIGDVIVRAIRTAKPHLEAGALVTVDSFRHRIRLLPI